MSVNSSNILRLLLLSIQVAGLKGFANLPYSKSIGVAGTWTQVFHLHDRCFTNWATESILTFCIFWNHPRPSNDDIVWKKIYWAHIGLIHPENSIQKVTILSFLISNIVLSFFLVIVIVNLIDRISKGFSKMYYFSVS